jgi:hypothetical protein
MKNYLTGVVFRLLLIVLMCISIPTGILINCIGFILGFILGFEITDEVAFKIMFWPLYLLDRVFKADIHRVKP